MNIGSIAMISQTASLARDFADPISNGNFTDTPSRGHDSAGLRPVY
jgi:hypothetical protein